MSRPAAQPRLVSDLPAPQAEALNDIHDLARRAGTLRGNQPYAPELVRLEHDRSIAEIVAASRAVPAVWITQAREYGQANRAWQPTTVLRDPPKNNVPRRGYGRVVADTNRLVDMATVSVLRHQHLHQAGIETDPEPAVAAQLRQNMAAIRTRIIHTAAAINMSPAQRARSTTVTDAHLAERLATHHRLAVDDLTALWRDLATPAIAASVRSSLASLRRTTTPPVSADPGLPMPPTVEELITRTHLQLINMTAADEAFTDGQRIETAVQLALPPTATEPDQHKPETTAGPSLDRPLTPGPEP
ncbi:hypothetical protein NN3_00630 [Nocardia neocaledoniensis NBRC 108232]|uniref:DUF222 domain-containing protein n=1 Tax=Nocardia neocaledoniensis TaxID=236511 RepID=A0A317NLD3_9NOCA|nr:hypothetical protein [Nocardia neocaledoniensis]PWV74448.1 hypothetical protein DFR69_106259 [Nocardia neocaledoniensis]GEM29056.1 hypothetical protein NN3_00630 [Nocardia neocaledoniensis NBRC 108232]